MQKSKVSVWRQAATSLTAVVIAVSAFVVVLLPGRAPAQTPGSHSQAKAISRCRAGTARPIRADCMRGAFPGVAQRAEDAITTALRRIRCQCARRDIAGPGRKSR